MSEPCTPTRRVIRAGVVLFLDGLSSDSLKYERSLSSFESHWSFMLNELSVIFECRLKSLDNLLKTGVLDFFSRRVSSSVWELLLLSVFPSLPVEPLLLDMVADVVSCD